MKKWLCELRSHDSQSESMSDSTASFRKPILLFLALLTLCHYFFKLFLAISINDVSSSWKATACRLFLLYQCFTVLPQILPRNKLVNFWKYAIGIRILCSKDLISLHIDLAEELIHDYIVEHETLYPSDANKL